MVLVRHVRGVPTVDGVTREAMAGKQNAGRRSAVDPATLRRLYVTEDRPLAELAATFRVGTKTVSGWLSDAGIPIRTKADGGRRRQLQPPPAGELRRLAGSGLSVPRIARELGVSPITAARWLREAGIPRPAGSLKNRPRGADRPLTPPTPDELRRLYLTDGLSIATIAGRLGVGAHLVRMWLADAGIPTRPAGGRRGMTRPAPRRKPVPPADELRELLLVQRLGRQGVGGALPGAPEHHVAVADRGRTADPAAAGWERSPRRKWLLST